MRINEDLLKDIYDYMKENENIYKLNEYVGLREDETPSFEDLKEYIKTTIISNLQYDFGVRIDMSNIIDEVQ